METWKRICVKDYEVSDSSGQHLELKRGEEYLTGGEHDHHVMVFTKFWADVPADLFAGEERFT